MGQPKALLRLTPDRPTLLETVAGAVGWVASDIVLVGRTDWPLPMSLRDLRRVEDDGNGAADGVLAALHAARFDSCLVVGCDMPFLDVELLREMAAVAEGKQRGVIVRDGDGPHPLHAIWRRADLASFETIVRAGERSLATIAREIGMVALHLDQHDEAARWSVFNTNTPADLEIARQHIRDNASEHPDAR